MDAAGGVFQIWKSTLQPVFQDLEPILKRLGELIEAAGPHVEKLIRHQRIEKQFSNSGWLPYYSELIERVEGHEGDAISLDRMISAYYRGHWTEIRREIEGRMETCEIDEEAIETLQEAFAAHESENYRSVCRLLLPEMGRSIRRNFFDDTGRIKTAEMTRTLAEYLAEDEILSRQVLCLVTIGRHAQHMYAQVDDDNRDQFEQNAIPNRHATVHGLVSYSTHKHSMNMIIKGFGRCLEFLLYSRAAAIAQCDPGRGQAYARPTGKEKNRQPSANSTPMSEGVPAHSHGQAGGTWRSAA